MIEITPCARMHASNAGRAHATSRVAMVAELQSAETQGAATGVAGTKTRIVRRGVNVDRRAADVDRWRQIAGISAKRQRNRRRLLPRATLDAQGKDADTSSTN